MSTISGVSSATDAHQTTNHNIAAKIPKELGVIGSNLKSGDLSSAQGALSTFQRKVQGNPPFGMNTQANSDYQNLMLALQTGDLSAAQQAFTSLQSALQTAKTSPKTAHGGLHHHGSSAGASNSVVYGLTKSSSTTSSNATSPATSATSSVISGPESDVDNSGVETAGSLLDMTA